MRKLILLLCVLLATFGLASCSEESYPDGTEVPREEQFVVGLECAYQPFNWTEDKKTDTNYPISNIKGKFAEGYDVQIAKKIAAELARTPLSFLKIYTFFKKFQDIFCKFSGNIPLVIFINIM